MDLSRRRATVSSTALAAVLSLAAPAAAWADEPPAAPGDGSGRITTVTPYEAYDNQLHGRPAPTASGAYWGAVDVRVDIAPDAGYSIPMLGAATATVTDATGTPVTLAGTAYGDESDGSYAWFHFDTRTLPDGQNGLHVSVVERATDPGTGAPDRAVEGDVAVRTANPHVTLVSPASHTVVWGPTTYTVDARVSAEGTPIDHVEFTDGPIALGSDSTAPYTVSVDYSGHARWDGVHAVAVDRDGYRSAVLSVPVTASPGPAVTVTPVNKVLDEDPGRVQFGVEWSAAVPDGWNTTVTRPEDLRAWLTEVEIAVDGRTVVTHRESDGCFTPLGLADCKHHNPSASWVDTLSQNGLALGAHRVSVTATDSTGVSHTTDTVITVGPDRLEMYPPGLPHNPAVQGQKLWAAVDIRSANSEALPSRPIAVQAQYPGSSQWHTVATTRTLANGDGAWFPVVATQNATYRAVTADSRRQLVSASFTVRVAPKVTLKPSATKVVHGRSVRLTASVTSRETGALVYLQVYRSGGWHTLATTRQSATGSASFTVREPVRGGFGYRVVTQTTARFAAAASPALHISVV